MDNIVLDQEASRELRVSRAIEIAEERFAKGEIQKEEFEAIKAQLQVREEVTSPTKLLNAATSPETPSITKSGWGIWFVLAVFVMMAPAFLNDLGWRLAGGVALIFIVISIVKNFFGK